MSLTLNIIEHELAGLGTVIRSERENRSYSDFRLYLGEESLRGNSVLYVCDSRDCVGEICGQGLCCIFVEQDGDGPDERAVISVVDGQPLLVVFNSLLDTFYRFGDWERQMDQARFSEAGLQDLLDISTPFLMNNVVIVDPALKLLAYTRDVPCDDPITVELIEHGYHTEDNIRKFRLHKRFKPWAEQEGFIVNDTYEICKYVTVVRSFKTRSSFSLIIVMMRNVAKPDGYLLDVYGMFAERVGHYARRDYPDDKPSGNAADTFLKDLFTGGLVDAVAIAERCKHAGVPFKARFCLFYIAAGDPSVPVSRLLSDVSREVAPAKTVFIDDAIATLCFNCTSDRCALHCSAGTCPLGRTSISARLNQLMERYDLVCGRSSKFTALTSAAAAFRQAEEAHRLGRDKLAVEGELDVPHNWSRIFSFDPCCIDYLVEHARKAGTNLAEFTYAGYVIDSIARQDAAAKTDNYTFLYTYLMCERRASVVAERLHMHRNNVKYRIDRIESQFGIDTNDPMLRFDFLLAFRIREASLVQNAQ